MYNNIITNKIKLKSKIYIIIDLVSDVDNINNFILSLSVFNLNKTDSKLHILYPIEIHRFNK